MSSQNENYIPICDMDKNAIIKKFQTIAASYTPNFRFDTNHPDLGSVLGIIYTSMTEDTINKLNSVMLKHKTELINTIGLKLKSAKPAKSIVSMVLNPTSTEGNYIEKGTKFAADSIESGETLIYQTKQGIYITPSNITDIYSTSKQNGKIVPCFLTDENSDKNIRSMKIELFNFNDDVENIEKHVLSFSHSNLISIEDELSVKIFFNSSNKEHITNILNIFGDEGIISWKLSIADKTYSFDKVIKFTDGILLFKSLNGIEISIDNETRLTISAEVKNSMNLPYINLTSIKLYAQKENLLINHVYNGDIEQDKLEFLPFSENVNMYSECVFSLKEVLSQKGSKAKLQFNLYYKTILNKLDEPVQEEELRLIMKRSRTKQYYMPAEIKADEIVMEYWNGLSWAILKTDNDISNLFNGNKIGEVEISFEVPNCEKLIVGAYEDFWIRFRIIRCDNTFKMPNKTIAPVIKNLRAGYSYPTGGIIPETVDILNNTNNKSILHEMENQIQTTIFETNNYDKPCVYIGFDEKPANSPISIFFDVCESATNQMPSLIYEYSAVYNKGLQFNYLKTMDKTEELKNSGLIMFITPNDFNKYTLFGKEKYWIRIVNADGAYDKDPKNFIKINGIHLNSVEVENSQDYNESFFVDIYEANMAIKLSRQNIVSVKVYVNEADKLSKHAIEEMITSGDYYQIEKDNIGIITGFWIEWKEVENFYKSAPTDRHFSIDRATGEIIFGDDFKGCAIPISKDAAIKVEYTVCDGSKGNVDSYQINRAEQAIRFVSEIYNPISAYGGYDFEDIDRAIARGVSLISNRGKAITKADYEAIIKNFSKDIIKIKSIHTENQITVAILLKEYYKGSHVFLNMKSQLESYIKSQSNADIVNTQVEIIEPTFVYVGATVWVKINDMENSFILQSLINDKIEEFLNPITGNFNKKGWEISGIPQKMQLISYLKSLKLNCDITNVILTGQITQNGNAAKKDIDFFRNTDDIYIGVSGKHEVIIEI